MSIHDEVAAAISANEPGYAQMVRNDNEHNIVSWHGGTFTETIHSGWDITDARCAFIDAWAKGKAKVTPGTFSDTDIRHRASQWEHGNGPHIRQGYRDPDFAKQILTLIA